MKITAALASIACFALSLSVTAGPGDLDLGFGGTGVVTTDLGTDYDIARGVAVQGDGKIVVVASVENGVAVTRYTADGRLDVSFNGTGTVVTAGGVYVTFASSVTVQNDGRILVAGQSFDSSYDFAVVRYNGNGSLDSGFGNAGKVTIDFGGNFDSAQSLALTGDGKILIVGITGRRVREDDLSADLAMVRLDSDGNLDPTFNGTGKVTTAVGNLDGPSFSVAIQSDGKIVVAAFDGSPSDFLLMRYNVNGSADGTFGSSGIVATDFGGYEEASAVTVQSDGQILAAGWSSNPDGEIALARYNPGGSLDSTLNGTGKVLTKLGGGVTSMAVQSDGKIVVGGYAYIGNQPRFAVLRYNANGSLDPSFNRVGKVTTVIGAHALGLGMALQSDGKIVIAGYTSTGTNHDFAVARYEAHGAEIAIEQPGGTELIDGEASVGFGEVITGGTAPLTFTIKNLGDTDLTGLEISFDGVNGNDFTVVASPTAPVAGLNGSTTFTIAFSPGSRGEMTAMLHLATNDTDESPFDIVLTGTGENRPPIARMDTAAIAYRTTTEIDVLANDSDADGDVVTITSAQNGAHGTTELVITPGGQRVRYTPMVGYSGSDIFTYSITDGFGGNTHGTVNVAIAAPPETHFVTLYSKGGAVPLAGDPRSGVPAGAKWKSFGVPSIASNGRVAFTAKITTRDGTLAVVNMGSSREEGFIGSPQYIVAKRGNIAPGAGAARFARFSDPLLNNDGTIVFHAELSGGNTLASGGIWKHHDAQGLGAPEMVARQGTQPPGIAAGARWSDFTSVALSDGAAGEELIAFIATMETGANGAPGPGGVTVDNDMGLWLVHASEPLLALRKGDALTVGGASKVVESFIALQPVPGAPGQGHGMTAAGVLARAKFDDRTQALLRIHLDGNGEQISVVALAGDPIPGVDVKLAKFGVPTQSSNGVPAFMATLTGSSNNTAIFQYRESDLEFVVRQGDRPLADDTAGFSTFQSVVNDSAGRVAFSAQITGGTITAGDDTALWIVDHAPPKLLAREGAQPPGVPPGALWSSFPSLALPDGITGPVFRGKLRVPGTGEPNPAGVTTANNTGVWAADSAGALRLIARTGDSFDASRTITTLTLLGYVSDSPTQARSFNATGEILYRATLSDSSQVVVKAQIP